MYYTLILHYSNHYTAMQNCHENIMLEKKDSFIFIALTINIKLYIYIYTHTNTHALYLHAQTLQNHKFKLAVYTKRK